MRLGFGLGGRVRITDMVALARRAEEEGFDSVWVHETSWQRDGVVPLSAMAQATSRIRLGAGCLNPFTRHPVLLAQTAATLQELSGGRFLLGLGTGYPARLDLMGAPHPSPAAAIREAVELLRRLLDGERLTTTGRVFSVKGVALDLGGGLPGRVPVYVAGWRRLMLRVAGQLADGYLARPLEPPGMIRQRLAAIREAARAAGRSLEGFEVAGYILCAAGNDDEQCFRALRSDPFVVYQVAVLDDDVAAAAGVDPDRLERIRTAYWAGDMERAADAISREILSALAVFGTPKSVAERLEAYAGAGVTLPILQPVRFDRAFVEGVWQVGRILSASWRLPAGIGDGAC